MTMIARAVLSSGRVIVRRMVHVAGGWAADVARGDGGRVGRRWIEAQRAGRAPHTPFAGATRPTAGAARRRCVKLIAA